MSEILTIAIGTYNNVDKLKLTLDSIVPQLNKNKSVKLLILDDSTNNHSKKLIKSYSNINIIYKKGVKISIDHAYIWLLKNAKGSFIWWFGDDVMYDNSIKRVLKIIKNEPDFVWLNCLGKTKTKDIGKDCYFNASQIIDNIGDLLTNLSSILWKRTFILPFLDIGKEKFGNAIGFCYPQIAALAQEGKFLYVDEPVFMSEQERDFKSLPYDPFDVFTTHYFELLQYFYSKKNIVNALKREKIKRGKQMLKGVLFYKHNYLDYGLGKTNLFKLSRVYFFWPIFWLYLPLILLIYLKSFISTMNFQGNKENIKNFISQKTLIDKYVKCNNCDATMTLFKKNIVCNHCNNSYLISDNVILLENDNDKFYEDKYGGNISYVHKNKSLISYIGLWLVNSGYLWNVMKHSPKNSVLLELGCGGGVDYFGKNYNTIGLDLSLSSLKSLKNKYRFCVKANIDNKLPFKNNSIDMIASSFFWEHIDNSIKNKCINELYRVLKPNGKIVFLFDVETKNPLINMCKKNNFKLYNELFINSDKHLGYETPDRNIKRFLDNKFKLIDGMYNEKTFFQSWSTLEKLSKFNIVSKYIYKKLNYLPFQYLFYPYTLFLRTTDVLFNRFLPINWSRTILIVLEKMEK